MIPYTYIHKAACAMALYRKHARMAMQCWFWHNLQTYKSALFILLVGSIMVIVDDDSFVKNEKSLLDPPQISLPADLEHHAFVNGRLRGEFGQIQRRRMPIFCSVIRHVAARNARQFWHLSLCILLLHLIGVILELCHATLQCGSTRPSRSASTASVPAERFRAANLFIHRKDWSLVQRYFYILLQDVVYICSHWSIKHVSCGFTIVPLLVLYLYRVLSRSAALSHVT